MSIRGKTIEQIESEYLNMQDENFMLKAKVKQMQKVIENTQVRASTYRNNLKVSHKRCKELETLVNGDLKDMKNKINAVYKDIK